MKKAPKAKTAVKSLKSGRWTQIVNNDNIAGYFFILPWLIGFLSFTILPIFASLFLSFTSYNLTSSPKWVGIENYVRMFTDDPLFFKSIKVTLYYVIFAVPLKVGFALLVAFLLHRRSRAANFYRSVFYLPSLIGGSVAVALIWKDIFSINGPINSLLKIFGLKGVQWLGDPRFAIWTLIAMTVWQFGSSMIIFAAGLKQIPETYYEAAKIDGASRFHSFIYITLPSLSPVIFFNLVMQMINAFMTFTQAFLITLGGPLDSTLFYALYLYRRAFAYFDMGYASAMAWILLIIIAAVTALVFKSSQYWVYYESKEK
ncbi:MAG: sugar ABC transporter permease [Clostridiaceae bacterium]|jgi:multiple sugar transport system permease protein|nr:sugar ABC transporter permease [Clostridiaceae bacterium]